MRLLDHIFVPLQATAWNIQIWFGGGARSTKSVNIYKKKYFLVTYINDHEGRVLKVGR